MRGKTVSCERVGSTALKVEAAEGSRASGKHHVKRGDAGIRMGMQRLRGLTKQKDGVDENLKEEFELI